MDIYLVDSNNTIVIAYSLEKKSDLGVSMRRAC